MYLTDKSGVIHTESGVTHLLSDKTFLIAQLIDVISQRAYDDAHGLFSDGLTCKLLNPGMKSWQSGRIRYQLVFKPDEPAEGETEAPDDPLLDEIRSLEG